MGNATCLSSCSELASKQTPRPTFERASFSDCSGFSTPSTQRFSMSFRFVPCGFSDDLPGTILAFRRTFDHAHQSRHSPADKEIVPAFHSIAHKSGHALSVLQHRFGFGPVAQVVERVACNYEVGGSTPSGSTKSKFAGVLWTYRDGRGVADGSKPYKETVVRGRDANLRSLNPASRSRYRVRPTPHSIQLIEQAVVCQDRSPLGSNDLHAHTMVHGESLCRFQRFPEFFAPVRIEN